MTRALGEFLILVGLLGLIAATAWGAWSADREQRRRFEDSIRKQPPSSWRGRG